MTKGWKIFGDRVAKAIRENLAPSEQSRKDWELAKIPNLHSLVPYSLESRKPIYECTAKDGLNGAHITKAKDSVKLFKEIEDKIAKLAA